MYYLNNDFRIYLFKLSFLGVKHLVWKTDIFKGCFSVMLYSTFSIFKTLLLQHDMFFKKSIICTRKVFFEHLLFSRNYA